MGIIYKITNKINSKSYIGLTTCTVEERWLSHIYDNNKHLDRPLYRAFKKYGVENFTIEVIEEDIPLFLLKQKERMCIKAFNTFKKGYNATLGGDGKLTIYNKYEIYQWYKTNRTATKTSTAEKFGISIKSVSLILKSYGFDDKRDCRAEQIERLRMPVNKLSLEGKYLCTYVDARTASTEIGKGVKGNTHINQCCNGKRKTAYGFMWEFAPGFAGL